MKDANISSDMITWVPPLAVGAVSLFATLRAMGSIEIRSKRFLGIVMFASLLATLLLSYNNDRLLPMDVFGMHLTSVFVAGITIILSIKEGLKNGAAAVILGIGIIVPITLIYANIGTYYHMNWIAIIITAGALLFGSDHIFEREHRDVDYLKSLTLAALIIITTVTLWFGLTNLGLTLSTNQYAIVQFSVLAFLLVETALILRVRKTFSNHDAMILAMELATLDLVMSFFSAVIIWN